MYKEEHFCQCLNLFKGDGCPKACPWQVLKGKALNSARQQQDRTNRTRLVLQIEDYFKETIADHWSGCHLCQTVSDVIWPESSCSRKPASWRESKTQWKSWLEGFFLCMGKGPWRKEITWSLTNTSHLYASICYISMLSFTVAVSCLFSDRRWSAGHHRFLRRLVPLTSPRSPRKSRSSCCWSVWSPLLWEVRDFSPRQKIAETQNNYIQLLYIYLEWVRMDILQVHIESHWVIECHIHE